MMKRNRKIKRQSLLPGIFSRIVKIVFAVLMVAVICILGTGTGLYLYFADDIRAVRQDMSRIAALRNYRPPVITTVYSDDGRKIAEFYKQRRIVTAYENIPKMLVNAFLSAEDSRFFEHPGVDLQSIGRAMIKNFEAGEVVQGGSTITQQVIKCLMLTPEKSYQRKLREAMLAWQIDKEFTKEQILYLYLNEIYLGHSAYGVAAAAENYFGKSLNELTLAECALIAGLPKAPSDFSPFKNPARALERRHYVLGRMVVDGFVSQAEADRAMNEPLNLQKKPNWYMESVPGYTEYVRRYVEEKYGQKALYEDGLTIHTAVNIEMQKAARSAVDKGLRELDKRHSGYRGVEMHLEPDDTEDFLEKLRARREKEPLAPGLVIQGVVDAIDEEHRSVQVLLGPVTAEMPFSNMRWGGKNAGNMVKSGDVIWVKAIEKPEKTGIWRLSLEQPPQSQSALVCLEAGTGYVKAMVGGRDFRTSQFNRAIQSRRQPGSAFKPIIYAAALDKGYTPATELRDMPFISRRWRPKNYDRRFHGQVLLRKALSKSMNLPTINLMDDIGVNYVAEYARKLGITSKLYRDMSLSLGSSGVSLLELTKAYSVFANGGERAEPVFITRITDRDGKVLEEPGLQKEQVIDATTAYLMTSLLESVVREGTGTRVLALKRPAAGKTGTTNDTRDAWFVGYTPDYITGTWVGYDQERPLGRKEGGGRSAIPIWLDFMKSIHEGKPVKSFSTPRGIVTARIDAETGLLPSEDTQKVIFECFKAGTVPTEYSRSSASVTETDQLFKMDM